MNKLTYGIVDENNSLHRGRIRMESSFVFSEEFKNNLDSIMKILVKENIIFPDSEKILSKYELEILEKKLNDLIELEPYKGDIKITSGLLYVTIRF